MAIEAELADGRILEFPDGTDPAVIQSTVKRIMGVKPTAPAASVPTPAPVPAAAFSAPAPVPIASASRAPIPDVAPAPAAAPAPVPIASASRAPIPAPTPSAPRAPGPAPVASAPRAPAVETAANVLPVEPTSLFGAPARPAATSGFAPGQEFVKGLKSGALGLKNVPGSLRAAGAADSLVAAQNRIALLDKIDAGQITTPRELRGQPGFDPRVGSYFASGPEVRAKLRADVTKDLSKDAKFMSAALAAYQEYRREAQALKGRTDEFTDIGSPTDFGNWLSKSIGEAGVQLAPVMLAAIALKQPGLLTAGTAMEFAGGVQNRMKFLDKELQQLPPEQRANRVAQYLSDTNDTTAAAAVLSGSLDLVLGPAARAAKASAKQILERSTRKGAAVAAAKKLPADVAGEFVTGAGQEAIQIGAETKLGEQKQPVSWENLKRVINAAAKEGAGAVVGTGVNVARAAAARPIPVPGAPEAPGAPARAEPEMGAAPAAPVSTRMEPEMGAAPAAPVSTRAEPEMGEAPAVPETLAQVEPMMGEAPVTPAPAVPTGAQRIEELTQQAIEVGLPEEDARARAESIVAAEEAERARQAQAKIAPRVATLTQEFVDAGVEPTQAQARAVEQAQQEVQADEDAAREQAGVGGAAAPIAGAVGESVGVAGQPAASTAAPGVGVSEPAAVVPTGQAPAADVGREGAQPSAVTTGAPSFRAPTQREKSVDRADLTLDFGNGATARFVHSDADVIITRPNGGRDVVIRQWDKRAGGVQEASQLPDYVPESLREPLVEYQRAMENNKFKPTEQTATALDDTRTSLIQAVRALGAQTPSQPTEPTDGTQTPEAQQAEAQGQEAPAAGAPAGVEAPVVRKRKPRVVAEGKKLGRPARLTEEQKADKAEAKKAIESHKKQANTATANAKAVLDALAKIDTIELDALGVDGRSALRNKKRQAIATLLDLQADPYLRGTAVGKRVNEALKHPSITPQELADLKKGLEAKKAGETVSKSTAPGSAADARFNKFTNGAQALSHIIKTGNAFQKLLGKRLRAFVTNVKFVVIEQGDALPAQLQTPENLKEWERARAVYIENEITREKVIYARGESFGVDQGVNNVTILHELLHAATNRKIGLALDAIRRGVRLNDPLVRAVQDLIRTMVSAGATYNEMARAGTLPPGVVYMSREDGGAALTDPRELLAYGMTDENFQNFLRKARGYEEDTSFFNRFVRSIRELFGMGEDTTNALSDLILVTDTILRSRAPSKGVFSAQSQISPSVKPTEETPEQAEAVRTQKEVDRAVAVASEKFSESKKGEEYANGVSVAQMAQDPRKVAEALRGVWTNFAPNARAALTRVAPTDFLADLVGDAVPELKNTDKLMQKMHGMTLNLLKSAGKLTDTVDRAYRKDPSLAGKLNEITFTSTIAEVDPSDPNAKERSAKLDALWNDLGADGQALYKQIKNHFEVLSDYFTRLLDEQITKSNLPIAERASVLQKVRALYEKGSKIAPYFPLVRRGDFWLSIGSGKTRKFFMYESAAERDRAMQAFADERIKQKSGESDAAFEKRRKDNLGELQETQEYGFGNDVSSLRKVTGNDSELLRAVFEAIDSMKLTDDDAKNGLKDAVYQIYLQTMPEQSFRRQFIHRKGYAGYRPDILRATADASTRMASQLARLKYGRLLRNSLSQARDSIANKPEFSEVLSAFERRVNEEVNPTPMTVGEKIAGGLNKASFIWYLGGVSSALLQPLSVFQTGFPVLAAKHGFGKASAALMKHMKVWGSFGVYTTNADGTKSFVMPTMEHAKGLRPETRRALRAMTDYGLTSSTYAGDVFDYKNTPSGNYSSPIVQFGKNTVDTLVLGGLMHATERISRELVFASSFELNLDAGKTFDEAIDQAVVDTKEALGNYGEYNRPEFMRGAAGKVLTQFMMYPVHISLFLLRNFGEMIKPMGGRTRQEARRKFFGTLGTSYILAGAVGLPMFSTVMGLLGWAWKQFEEEDDPEDLKDMSFELWFRTVWLQEQLGEVKVAGKSLADVVERGVANAITGLDISGRTSLNNMWMRDTKENATVRDSAAALALEKAGPAANMVLSWAEAYEAFMQGDYAKGVKKATPAGFRNFVTTYELYKQGAKDNKGAEILSRDAFTTGELIGQAVGFRSDLLANTQYVTFKVIGLEQRINNERNRILNNLDRELRKNDVKAYSKYYKEMTEFNRKYPSYEISDEDFVRSMESKQERRATSYRGVTLTEKNVGVLAPALVPSRRAATEKEKKGRGE